MLVALATALSFGLAGCSTPTPDSAPNAGAAGGSVSPPLPGGAGVISTPPSVGPEDCDPRASLTPGALPAPGQMPAGSTMARIADRGRLIVGVDQNTYLFGFRNPQTGALEGFDIDIAHELAKAIFGDPNRIQYRVINSAERIPALQDGSVDLVVRTMTITCDRLKQIGFSTVYYDAAQRILVPKGSPVKGAADLGPKTTVCAAIGSTSINTVLALQPSPKVIGVTNWTDCLVLLQQGQADAVSTDDSILFGLAAQDPYVALVGDPLADEPYGVGVKLENTDLVRFVNGVLDKIRADGTWAAIYSRWLGRLGPTPAPPPAKYRG
jgi:polar amino acid transport system substrate-binding protein